MAKELRTSTGAILAPYAAATMREAAESTIKYAVEAFEKAVREKVYFEVERIAIKYVEMMTAERGVELHIVIDDRRETK